MHVPVASVVTRKEMSESQSMVMKSLEKKQKNLAMALESVNDLDMIKQLVELIGTIQTTINLMN